MRIMVTSLKAEAAFGTMPIERDRIIRGYLALMLERVVGKREYVVEGGQRLYERAGETGVQIGDGRFALIPASAT